jgi:hypothetical protein
VPPRGARSACSEWHVAAEGDLGGAGGFRVPRAAGSGRERATRGEVVEQRADLLLRQRLIGHPLALEFFEERQRRAIAVGDEALRRADPGQQPCSRTPIGHPLQIGTNAITMAERVTTTALLRKHRGRFLRAEGKAAAQNDEDSGSRTKASSC